MTRDRFDKMSTAPLITSHQNTLWIDGSDALSTTVVGGRLTKWTRKDPTGGSFSAPPYTFGADLAVKHEYTGISWRSVAISGDGRVVFVVSDSQNRLLRSMDMGETFADVPYLATLGDVAWTELSISYNGQYIVVGGLESGLFVSTDSGDTWTANLTDDVRFWEWTSMSDDGRYILASCFGDFVYSSVDNGTTWRALADFPTDEVDVGFVWVSPSGRQQIIAYFGGDAFVSQDFGMTFAAATGLPAEYWYEVSASVADVVNPGAEVNLMYIWGSPGNLYRSLDGGVTWEGVITDQPREWIAVSSSQDGRIVLALPSGEGIRCTLDGGVTWTILQTDPQPWSAIIMNAAGEAIITIDAPDVAPVIFRNETIQPTTMHLSVRRSDIQAGITSDASGRTLIVADESGRIYGVPPSQEPRVQKIGDRNTIFFDTAVLTSRPPHPAIEGGICNMTFLFVVQSKNGSTRAPLITFSPNHYIAFSETEIAVRWGPGEATSIPKPLAAGFLSVVGLHIGPVYGSLLQDAGAVSLWVNNSLVLSNLESTTESAPTNPIILGGESAELANPFFGNLAEVMAYRGNLRSNLSSWNALHFYLGRKYGVRAALPHLTGIGSDPHIKTLMGDTYDLNKAGIYTLLSRGKDFRITCKISTNKDGTYMDSLEIINGIHTASIVFKSRGFTLRSQTQTAAHSTNPLPHVLALTDINWDVWPPTPKRLVKTLRGFHPVLGRFHLRVDYKHRYLTPHFPDFFDWETCGGILANKVPTSVKRKLQVTAPKPILRPLSSNAGRHRA